MCISEILALQSIHPITSFPTDEHPKIIITEKRTCIPSHTPVDAVFPSDRHLPIDTPIINTPHLPSWHPPPSHDSSMLSTVCDLLHEHKTASHQTQHTCPNQPSSVIHDPCSALTLINSSPILLIPSFSFSCFAMHPRRMNGRITAIQSRNKSITRSHMP